MSLPSSRMLAFAASLLSVCVAGTSNAQLSTAPTIGIADRTPSLQAFTHARLIVRPGEVIADGTMLVRDGVIQAVGAHLDVPAAANVIDLHGKTVYPGFIEPLSDYGQAGQSKHGENTVTNRNSPSMPDPRAGSHSWNAMVHPESDVAAHSNPNQKQADALRALGFTDVLSVPQHGVFRGQSSLISLADSTTLNPVLIAPRVAQHVAFEVNGWGSSDYPGSLMGAIALIRQTLLDARWQQQRLAWESSHPRAERSEANQSLNALQPVLHHQQAVFFATDDELDYQRAQNIANEFKLDLVLVGNGHEYRRVAQLKRAGVPVIIPLKLPEAPKIEDPDRALDVGLAELKHWQWAPYNARILAEAGVPIAFTAHALKESKQDFRKNIRRAIEDGLTPQAALAALTTGPARMLGVEKQLGSLQAGHLAHFIIADADLLRSEDARIYAVWIGGQRHQFADLRAPNPRGSWNLQWVGTHGPASVEVSGTDKLSAKVGDVSFPLQQDGQRLLMYFPGKLLGSTQDRVTLIADLHDDGLTGRAEGANGQTFSVRGQRVKPADAKTIAAWSKPALPSMARTWPAGAHGRHGLPAQADALLVRNARIWTQGPQGILEDADLLVENGKIVAVGKDLSAPSGAHIIDAQGKQVSPGIIDAHSHIAISRGVNEGTHAVTSEVRIGDVLDPTDIIIYRHLAGGTTSAQVLHGSANPIGGQSQIIKLRWGADAAGLKFKRAPESIKFALGENVKQSNWGAKFTTRYPQTRMGVEQIDIDSFLAAKAYGAALKAGHADDGGPLRRDLRLEALWEVLQDERLVQIHSYRQDEILAFIRTCERFGIVPTFQHVLEGYKVANAIAKLGAGASTFSDWWAYKYEVIDAIPYNGAMMTRQGITVSFNSDDDELARRLNTEAAKSIKYGNLSPVEALNLVTINPAKQLHIDKYVGSLEAGKDADFVIWSDSPLSSMAIPLETWVDGRKYFDRDQDRLDNASIASLRQQLIAAVLPERVKALKKAGKDHADKADAKTPTAAPDIDAAFCGLLAQRPIYHDSKPAAACAEGEDRS
ncbi:MAG: amidohydrolase family protein [Xanthomonadales bacterium]|nr:amidohydrolase family protein [Xanthomonadales bacterium]